jgi:hypothetical protein
MICCHRKAQSKISTDRETIIQKGGHLACLGTNHPPIAKHLLLLTDVIEDI